MSDRLSRAELVQRLIESKLLPADEIDPPPADATIAPGSASASPTVELRAQSTAHGKKLAVLLVEPSRTQAGIIRRYLQNAGIEHVVTVASGHEALQAVRAESPDAVLSAMHLADMTGFQLAQQVRSEGHAWGPGFLLIASESESKEAGMLTQSGHGVVLHKPFTVEKLVQALSLASPKFLGLKPPAADRGSVRVLIVDDSVPARMRIRSVLAGLGFVQFVEAGDGAQGVAAVARDSFQLIVTDYNMPHMDGLALVGFLKQNPATASVPIIMVTTETDPARLEPVRKLGVAAICDKSFDPEVVRGIVDRCL